MKNIKPKNSDKQFFYFFIFIFSALFFYFYYYENKILSFIFIILILSLFFLFVFKPSKIHKLNILWFRFGIFIARFFSPIILFLIYFGIILPIKIILIILRKDILNIKLEKNKKSYWLQTKNEQFNNTMDNQF